MSEKEAQTQKITDIGPEKGVVATAAAGIKEGAADAEETARTLIPAVGRAVSKTAYGSCYYLSYGIVLSALAVARAIPLPATMRKGFQDGAKAAEKTADRWEEKAEENRTETEQPA